MSAASAHTTHLPDPREHPTPGPGRSFPPLSLHTKTELRKRRVPGPGSLPDAVAVVPLLSELVVREEAG